MALFSREYRAQLVLAIAMPFFQMATGINAVVFFSPQLFGGIGSFGEGAKGGLIASAVIGTVQVDFILPPLNLTAARLCVTCDSCCALQACLSCTHKCDDLPWTLPTRLCVKFSSMQCNILMHVT